MSSQHRRRQSAYLSQGPAPHWFSTPRQYTARPMAQHSSQVCRASVVWTKPHKPASQQREASPGWLRHDKHSADWPAPWCLPRQLALCHTWPNTLLGQQLRGPLANERLSFRPAVRIERYAHRRCQFLNLGVMALKDTGKPSYLSENLILCTGLTWIRTRVLPARCVS